MCPGSRAFHTIPPSSLIALPKRLRGLRISFTPKNKLGIKVLQLEKLGPAKGIRIYKDCLGGDSGGSKNSVTCWGLQRPLFSTGLLATGFKLPCMPSARNSYRHSLSPSIFHEISLITYQLLIYHFTCTCFPLPTFILSCSPSIPGSPINHTTRTHTHLSHHVVRPGYAMHKVHKKLISSLLSAL